MLFQNRIHAGRRLARALVKYRACHPVVLALPRGGVPVLQRKSPRRSTPPLTWCLYARLECRASRSLRWAPLPTAKRQPSFANSEIIKSCGVDEREFDAVWPAQK